MLYAKPVYEFKVSDESKVICIPKEKNFVCYSLKKVGNDVYMVVHSEEMSPEEVTKLRNKLYK